MKFPITKKQWFWIIAILAILSIIGKFLGLYNDNKAVRNEPVPQTQLALDSSITYEIATSEDYGIGLKNHSYRIIVDENATDKQLLWVYSELNNSKYEEVTIWFYKNKTSIENGVYDVAMIEIAGSGLPKITR